MHAIILAAGRGSRLQSAHADAPKCLLRFGERSLLERHLLLLERAGAKALTLVVGHQYEKIEAELQRLGPALPVHTIFNPDFHAGSVISLWAARKQLVSGQDILLMDADVLYDARMLTALANTPHDNCFLFDGDYTPGDEPVKLCLRGEQLVEFRKRVADDLVYDRSGESVGFFRFGPAMARRLADKTNEYRNQNEQDVPHEEAIRDLLLADPRAFGYADVSGVPWIEIDFPEDILRAKREILPALTALPSATEL